MWSKCRLFTVSHWVYSLKVTAFLFVWGFFFVFFGPRFVENQEVGQKTDKQFHDWVQCVSSLLYEEVMS